MKNKNKNIANESEATSVRARARLAACRSEGDSNSGSVNQLAVVVSARERTWGDVCNRLTEEGYVIVEINFHGAPITLFTIADK